MPHIPGHGHSPGQRFYNQPGQGQAGIQTEDTSMVGADGWSNTSTPGADPWTAQQATNQAIWDQLAMGGFTGGVNTNPGGLDYSNPGQIPTGHAGGAYTNPAGWANVDPGFGNIYNPNFPTYYGFDQIEPYYSDLWGLDPQGQFHGGSSTYPFVQESWAGQESPPGTMYHDIVSTNWWFQQALNNNPEWANQFMTGIDDQGNPIWDQQGILDAYSDAGGYSPYGSGADPEFEDPTGLGYLTPGEAWADFGSFNFQGGIDPNLGGASWGSFTPQGPGGTPPPTPGGAPSPSPTPNPFQNPYKRNQNNPLGNV